LRSAWSLLTQRGARIPHAVVARQLRKACLVGCSAQKIDMDARALQA
jgi:phosphoenolpyruvate synthase/pyruvate phosphate dikinase